MARIDYIRQEFPHPVALANDDGMNDTYCIGGALCMAAYPNDPDDDHELAFPATEELAAALRILNPDLPETMAAEYAIEIIDMNDHEQFALSWHYANLALEYGK